MAWNEPGNDDNKDKKPNRDPWSGGDNQGKGPDLDEVVRRFQKKFRGFFGGHPSKSGSGKGGFFGIIILFLIIIIGIWALTGIYVIGPQQKGVVLRFGKYQQTVGPGLHWLPRFIESEHPVNVEKLHTYTYPSKGQKQADLMLTRDQDIVAVAITVQYRINNPKNYLFSVVNPIESLHQATASALRQVIGQMNLNDILTTGRDRLRNQVKTKLEAILKRYQTGLHIINAPLKTARAPKAVQDAFDDAVKAQEDEKRFINQAKAYKSKVQPIAKGKAQRLLTTAKAYKKQIVLQAQAKTSPFLALLDQYQQGPKVMRERLYLQTMEQVLQNSSKIFMDVSQKQSHNLLNLPLGQVMNQQNSSQSRHSEQENSDQGVFALQHPNMNLESSMSQQQNNQDSSAGTTESTSSSANSSKNQQQTQSQQQNNLPPGYGSGGGYP